MQITLPVPGFQYVLKSFFRLEGHFCCKAVISSVYTSVAYHLDLLLCLPFCVAIAKADECGYSSELMPSLQRPPAWAVRVSGLQDTPSPLQSCSTGTAKISQPLNILDSFNLHTSNKLGSLYYFIMQRELDLLYANQLKTGNTSLRRKTVNHQLLISLTFSSA